MAEHTFLNSDIKVGCHHLANEFSKEHEVFYLSTPISPYHILKSDKKHLKNKIEIYKNKGIDINRNLKEYIPMTLLPIYNIKPFNKVFFMKNTLKVTIPNLKKIIEEKNFLNVDLLIISTPYFAELIDTVSYKKCIYRITDDYSKFDHLPDKITYIEDELIRKCDEVIVTSKPLYNKIIKVKNEKNVIYMNNGVNLKNFIKKQYNCPIEYLNDKNKKAIYIGAIETWFDTELLEYVAKSNSDVNFYIIGNDKIDAKNSIEATNVKFLGVRNYRELSNYLKYADLGIIPFKINDLINSVSPIKLYEYASIGLPIVTTEWDELSNINIENIYKAKNFEEFNQFIKVAKNKNKSNELIEFAKSNDWSIKAKYILKGLK